MKYVSSAVTFAEFPNEIALCLNISNCPCLCENCSQSELAGDFGTILDEEELDKLIKNNEGITLIGFMGGDSSHETVKELCDYIHKKYKNIKVGMYSGREYFDMLLLNCLDVYKIGKWIQPKGPINDWPKQNCGPLKFPFSNQLYFVKENNLWINKTYLFRQIKINNLEREIIK